MFFHALLLFMPFLYRFFLNFFACFVYHYDTPIGRRKLACRDCMVGVSEGGERRFITYLVVGLLNRR